MEEKNLCLITKDILYVSLNYLSGMAFLELLNEGHVLVCPFSTVLQELTPLICGFAAVIRERTLSTDIATEQSE